MALTFDVRVGDLNWLFLVYAVAVVVVILFYLFYFGRLLASIISIVLRTVLWRRFKVWLDIGSIQFSPLGGRLLFRDVRYVGENQTITIAMGSITWRYWLWKVRQDDDLRRGQLGDTLFTVALLMSATEDSRLPCRTSIKLEGAEWFIYNRNAAFDMLLDHLSRRDKAAARSASTSDSETNEKGAARILPPSNENHMNQDPDVIDWFRESLPLELNVIKGAIVMGNRSTPSLIVAGFRSAVGTCGAVKSRSMHDFYKQIYQFTFSTPRILFRKNHDFEESMLAHGAHMQQNQDATVNQKLDGSTLQRGAFAEILRKCTTFAELVYNPSSRAERKKKDQAAEWHGLARYREAVENLYSTKAAEVGSDRQYGKVSTVYDNGDSIDLTYYADVAGYVPEGRQKPHSFSNLDKPDIGNGDLSPEWGVDIRLNGGTLTYGPWADRQRVAIQNAFFPPAYFDTEITQSLRAGDRRLHTALKIFMDFSQTTTFRLPSREASKDWKYDGKDPVMDTSRRPYGWLDMALGPDSSFTFVLPMIAGATGYETFLEIHLDSLMIYSSVNYEKFLEAKSCRVSCQLPQPLAWDARHDWNISVTVERPEVFFLRDHAYLLTDMVRDWTAGDPPDYQRFVPFTYTLKLAFNDYKLYLYLNERNIVNNPSVIEDNTLLLITGPKLAVDMMVPSDQYRPLYTKMTTQLEAGNISLSMLAPASNTHQAWLTSRTEVFGKVDTLRCSISHMMFAEGHSNNVETLDINLEMNGVLFEALGWVIKYFIEVKDNYFGAYNNFTTTAEADLERNKVSRHNALNPLQRKHDLCPPDVFEVHLEVVSRNGVILFPEEVHDCKSGLVLNIPEVGVHLRNHDYYMELLINVDPLTMVFSDKLESVIMAHSIPASTNHNRVILDGMTIAAHRLFGPQPLTSTYVAMWSFGLGHLAADLTIPHFASLQRIARAFVSNFLDEDNTLHDDDAVMPLPDVTFLSATLRSIDVNVWSRDSAVNLAVPLGLSIHFNDHVSRGSLTRIEVTAPSIQARGLVHSQANQWSEVTSCDLSLSITATTSSTDWEARELTQKRFLATQDLLTARCSFLYEDGSLTVDQVHSRLGSLFNIPLDAVHDLASFQLDSTPSQSWKVERRKHKVSSRSDKTEDSDFSSLSYGSLLRVFRLIPSGVLTTNQTNVFQPIGDIPEEQRRTRRYSRSSPVANAYSPSNESERFTRIHAEMERTVRLMCSPKAVKVAEDVVATLEQNYEPEHWIDELDDRFRKALPVQVDPDRHESFRASLSIRAVSLMLVQDVLRPGDLDLPEALDGNISPDASILCTAHLSIRNIEASALSVQAFKVKDGLDSQAHHDLFMNSRYRSAGGAPIDPVIKTKEIAFHTGKLRLGVKHVSPNTSETSHAAPTVAGLPSASSGTVLEAFVNGLDAYAELPDQYQRFSVRLLDSGVDAVSSAAELVTGTVHSWFIVSRAIEKAVFHAHYRPVSSYRRLVTDILQFAHREEIVTDPLFLNRPTAAAVHLRSNTDWKIMAHVRHVLRRLSEASRRQLQGSFRANVSAAEDFKNLVARLQEWHNWELDELVIRRLPLIQSLFRPVEFASALSQPDPHNEAESEGASAQATDLQLVIATRDFIVTYFEDGQCTNSLLLRPTELFAAQNTSEDAAAMVRLTIGPILLVLDPGILRLIVHISRVRRVFGKKLEPLIPRPFAERVSSSSSFADCSVPLRASIQLEAVEVSTRASGVRATLIVQGLCGFAALSVRKSGDRISATTSQVSITSQMVKMLTITEGALPTREGVKESTGTLISVQLEGFSSHATFDLVESAPNRYLHLLGMVASVRVRIPRSVLRMSQFFEQWRAESLPQTKVAFDALRRDVELQNSDFSEQLNNHDPKRKGEQKQNASSKLHLSLHLHLPVLSFHIRAAQKFWLDYSIGRMALHGDGQVSNSEMSRAQCTLSLQSQTVDFIAVNDPRLQGEGAPFGGESIHFPAVLASVKYDGKEVKALATLERIAVTVTAGVLDSVFTVQKRFEHDIDEILSVFAKHKTKRKQAGAKQLEPLPLTEQRSLRWSGQLVLRGLNVGLKGPLSTQYIGADLVDGYVSHIPGEGQADTRWELHASNLALSLAQETAEDQITGAVHGIRKSSFDRTYRLAYFVLDIQAGNRVAEVEELKELTGEELIKDAQASHLHIKVGKVHAVMQTAAIEALDKLLEHFTSEIAQRRDARAQEFAAIKEKVIMTFDIQEKKNSTRVLPWIERCVLSVRINDVGIAIPLQDVEIDAPFFGHQLKPESKSRPAFLVSTPSLLFATSKASAGVADISDLSAQFVKTFDQTKPRDFAGYHHDTRNRLLLPSSGVKIATDAATASKAKAFTVNAKMSGTQLDIDGSIVQSVFRLLELYELSYKRLARHAPEVVGAADMTGFPKSQVETAEGSEPDLATFFDTTTFEATFQVESGVIRMHGPKILPVPASQAGTPAPPQKQHQEAKKPGADFKRQAYDVRGHTRNASTMDDVNAPQSFVIPKLSMWSVKKDSPGQGASSNLHFDALVHSSRNILQPKMLPFLSEVADALKAHMEKESPKQQPQESSSQDEGVSATPLEPSDVGNDAPGTSVENLATGLSTLRNLCISVSLRIDKSSLQLNCVPIAPVSAGLEWQSGGLVIVVQPGRRSLHASLSVAEVGFEIRHAYSPERCLTGAAQGLVLAFSLSPASDRRTLVSIEFDSSSINAEINFRQMHDFLCFKAVWLDRLEQIVPLPEGQVKPAEKTKVPGAQHSGVSMTTVVLARIQQVRFTCMLGHSIGTVNMTATMLLGRLRQIPMHSRSFSVDLQALELSSKGRLAGALKTDGLYFESYLHDIMHSNQAELQNCTSISAFIGVTDGSLEFDYRKTLLLSTEPIKLGVSDDWTKLVTDNELGLDFSLRFGSVSVIATTQTVPTLVKLGKDLEKLIEDRRAKTRALLLAHKATLPKAQAAVDKIEVKAVTEVVKVGAVLPSAIPEGTKVVGKIELEADRLRIAIFLHHFTDQEAFRADAGEVRAVLSRFLNEKKTVVRDLDLNLGFFSVKKMRPKQRVTPVQEREHTIQDWLDLLRAASDRNIFKFPTSQAHMASTQEIHTNRIHHRFSLVFTGQVDISLNYALLKQLGALLSAYHDGMKHIEDDEASGSAPAQAPEPTPLTLNGENGLESDIEGPAKRVLAANIPPPQSIDVVGSREYIALENNIQQPQLQLLGEATPPLEWLGLQRSHAPALVHEACTLILEHALLELSAVYRKSLSKAASIS